MILFFKANYGKKRHLGITSTNFDFNMQYLVQSLFHRLN
jgi:hypothetical protein